VQAGLLDPRGIHDERRLTELLPLLDQTGDALVGQLATPRIS
jgi:hypothetical protein